MNRCTAVAITRTINGSILSRKPEISASTLKLLQNLAASNQLPILAERFERAQTAWKVALEKIAEGQEDGLYVDAQSAQTILVISESFKACLVALRDVEGITVRTQYALEIARQAWDVAVSKDPQSSTTNIVPITKTTPSALVEDEELQGLTERFELTCNRLSDALTKLESAIRHLTNTGNA